MHSAVADAKPWPEWLCPSGALASQLRPLDDVPCFSDESSSPPLPSSPPPPLPSQRPSPTTPATSAEFGVEGDEQSHKKAAVSAKLAQDEEEARAQAAVAANRKQAATLEGCVHLGKVKQKPVDLRWWYQGVHQIVLWVGTARQGKGASKGSGKGKGAGAAVAERYPKAKTKGKKW